jgi:hypothetical protein
MAKSYLHRADLPRGLRNNNPGNLVQTAINWQGKIPLSQNTDSRFEQFVELRYGIRAMILDMINDYKMGLTTLGKLINEYAPGFENNTAAYIKFVSDRTGIPANSVFPPTTDNFAKITRAMIEKEIGTAYISYVTTSDIQQALSMINTDMIIKASGIGLGVMVALGASAYFFYKYNKNK